MTRAEARTEITRDHMWTRADISPSGRMGASLWRLTHGCLSVAAAAAAAAAATGGGGGGGGGGWLQEKHISGTMLSIGLSGHAYWLARWGYALVVSGITCALTQLTGLAFRLSLFVNSDGLLLYLCLVCWPSAHH